MTKPADRMRHGDTYDNLHQGLVSHDSLVLEHLSSASRLSHACPILLEVLRTLVCLSIFGPLSQLLPQQVEAASPPQTSASAIRVSAASNRRIGVDAAEELDR